MYFKNRIIIFFLFLYFVLTFIFFLPLSFDFLRISLFRFVLVDFVLLSLVSFSFRWFRFVSLISFRFVFVDFVSFRFVSFSLISFRFVSFRFYFVSHFIGTPSILTHVTKPTVCNRQTSGESASLPQYLGSFVATSADSVPSSYLVCNTIAPIETTFGNLQLRRY